MEFELTLRGNTEELPPLLELLGKNGGFLKEPGALNLTEPDIPSVNPWTYGLQESLWNDLSGSARDLMLHLCMQCEGGDLYGEWICNPDGFGHDLLGLEEAGYCEEGIPCETPEDHRRWVGFSDGIFVDPGCGINSQSLGARLANIARNFADPKYRGQTEPVEKFRQSADHETGNVRHTYALRANWPQFVLRKWVIGGGWGSNLSKISDDEILG